jgi:glycosyltransferase involved in cell wall biosynthesis
MPELTTRRGAAHVTNSEICTIVMSYLAQPSARDAVLSLLAQDRPGEIVVVNSGGPSLEPVLGDLCERVLLVETSSRLLPGGARNVGIRLSAAPIVSFLAADCLAVDGWYAERLASHHDGHETVASALRPAPKDGVIAPAAMASYWATHWLRMPETPREMVSPYGLSYTRQLLDRFGPFREDLLVSEDSMYNSPIAEAGFPPHWNPKLVTLHAYPHRIWQAWRDQFKRGYRLGKYRRKHLNLGLARMARRGLVNNARVLPSITQWLGSDEMRRHANAARLLSHLQWARLFGAAVGAGIPRV